MVTCQNGKENGSKEIHVYLILLALLVLECEFKFTEDRNGMESRLIYESANGSSYTGMDSYNGVKFLIWAVHVNVTHDQHDVTSQADLIADEIGLHKLGSVGELADHFLFSYLPESSQGNLMLLNQVYSISDVHSIHKKHVPDFEDVASNVGVKLSNHPAVVWFERQTAKSRQKRSTLHFKDPQFPKQWHLVNFKEEEMDINVTGVWDRNITGRGVTVAILDDGLEWTNPDIRPNYNAEGSWDLNSEDGDPMPSGVKVENHHGTRCAGEVAAAANHFCGVGVAYEAKVSGLRILDGPMTDSLEASGFNKNMQINDVYSCSWGPDDDGKTVDGPQILAKRAMHHGIDFGRHGYGSIYVVASGNGGEHQDNCNYDGYANSIYTITVGAVDETGQMPYYGEECASMLAVTFSSGGPDRRSIVTTDWRKDGGTGCTARHSGTSAAAPLAAGMIALMLQARPCLTWRDVQYLIILTALKVDINIGKWQKNGAGLHHSLEHGFGLMKAWRLVNAAKVWKSVPWVTVFNSELFTPDQPIPNNNQALILSHTVTAAMMLGYELKTLEQVQVIVTLSHWRRGNLEIRLTCPSGTQSIVGAARPKDSSGEGLNGWVFSTVRCWGEMPLGEWSLTVIDTGAKTSNPTGMLRKWQLRLFGSPMTPEEFQSRKRLISEAMSGKFLNDSYNLPCPPPDNTEPEKPVIEERVLKVLLLSGAFCIFVALYETMEYALCYNDEKQEHKKLLSLTARAQRLARRHSGVTYHQISGEDTAIGVEEECIPMTALQERHLLAVDGNNEDVLFCAETDTSLKDLHNGIPKEIVDSLSQDEIKLNLELQVGDKFCDSEKREMPELFDHSLASSLVVDLGHSPSSSFPTAEPMSKR
ncbi:proprotein convertase subtilisin/kexin type 7-like [Liolophura sinensis]|uniref:proprotein convertase subtilisin/kexin type 7-like n=1 Tax=Liolophura sinensis TaxID=3198878 RepID=UPI003158E683